MRIALAFIAYGVLCYVVSRDTATTTAIVAISALAYAVAVFALKSARRAVMPTRRGSSRAYLRRAA